MAGNLGEWEVDCNEITKLPCSNISAHHDEFAKLLVDRVGENLRMVCYYNEHDIAPYLIHDDLPEENLQSRIATLHRRAVEDFSISGSTLDGTYGDLQVRIAIHSDVAVLCFQEDSGVEGLITTIEYQEGLLSIP